MKNDAQIFICGDVVNKFKEDGLLCSDEISNEVNSADFAICNFEAPIEGKGKPARKPGICLNQKVNTIIGLKKQGFDLLLLANNHMLDYGQEALMATINKATENGLETIGAGENFSEAYRPLIKNINGIRVGMINVCEAQYGEIDSEDKESVGGYAWINHPMTEKNILDLRKECDFVIVFAHAGLEYYSIPQREWRIKYKHFCDLGADVIIGSHPHVPQGYETYKKSIIFYSLGNFYFKSNKKSCKENASFAVKIKLELNQPISFQLIYHYMSEDIVKADHDSRVNVAELNALLANNAYMIEHTKMIEEAYNGIRKNLALSVFLPVPLSGKFKDFIRMFVSHIFKRNYIKYKDLYQLHLLKNETYYYVIKNALEIKSNRNN